MNTISVRKFDICQHSNIVFISRCTSSLSTVILCEGSLYRKDWFLVHNCIIATADLLLCCVFFFFCSYVLNSYNTYVHKYNTYVVLCILVYTCVCYCSLQVTNISNAKTPAWLSEHIWFTTNISPYKTSDWEFYGYYLFSWTIHQNWQLLICSSTLFSFFICIFERLTVVMHSFQYKSQFCRPSIASTFSPFLHLSSIFSLVMFIWIPSHSLFSFQ